MIKRIIQITSLVLFAFACKFKGNNNEVKNVSTYPSIGSIDTSFRFYNIKETEKYLNLQSLRNGVDSFEMRLYILGSLDVTNYLFTVVALKDKLIKKNYISFINSDSLLFGAKKSYVSDFALTHSFSFKNSDTSFRSLFMKSQVDTLPTQGLISDLGENQCLDGATYILEIATKKSYKVLCYVNPDCCKHSIQNKLFENFLHNFFELINQDDKLWYKKNEFLKSLIISKE